MPQVIKIESVDRAGKHWKINDKYMINGEKDYRPEYTVGATVQGEVNETEWKGNKNYWLNKIELIEAGKSPSNGKSTQFAKDPIGLIMNNVTPKFTEWLKQFPDSDDSTKRQQHDLFNEMTIDSYIKIRDKLNE